MAIIQLDISAIIADNKNRMGKRGYIMERTWLVQRLKKPTGHNPFVFGGGDKNGGLKEEAMDMLSKVFSFDYMGCAEYEFGAVSEGLTKIFDNKDKLVYSSFMVNWEGEVYSESWEQGDTTVYYICQKDHEKEVRKFISKCAKGKEDTKGGVRFGYSMANPDYGVVGWLELNNGFFFSTDGNMWDDVCRLFSDK